MDLTFVCELINYVGNQHLAKGCACSVLLAKPFPAGNNACVMLTDKFYPDSNLGELVDFDLDT